MEVSVQETRAEERFVHDLAQQLRVDSIRCTTAAGSGHPTSALSSADLMAALFAWHLRYDWDAPEDPGNDHLIFSKGHASPLLYSLFKAAGGVSEDELMETYRRRVEAFGCQAIVIDGHDLDEIDRAYAQAEAADRPSVIIAGTRKGKGV